MTEFNIFYAWQNDLPPKENRYFIRDAVKNAIKLVDRDISLEESPRFDSDTLGESGMPEIAATIFNKIELSGIFIADLSFVGETYENLKAKRLPNPNVLLELGFATAKIGWDRVICIMNTHYGNPEEVIFDIQHRRFPIAYCLHNENQSEKSDVKSKLTEKICLAIKSCLQAEHQAVLESTKSLDRDCFTILSSYGNEDSFVLPQPQFAAQAVNTQIFVDAARHMLELNLLETVFDNINRVVSYKWTYLGKLLLAHLGFKGSR